MNIAIKSMTLALVVLAVLSYGTHSVMAQNVTSTTRDHDRDHFFGPGLGVRLGAHLPLLGAVTGGAVVRHDNDRFHNFGTTVVGNVGVRPDYDRFHNFALAHHDHFIYLNNRYVILPQTVGCPQGSQLNVLTGQCEIINQVVVNQAAPTILQESVPQATVTESVQAPAVTEAQTTTQTEQPIVTCPAGSTAQADGTCTVTTTSQSTVQPLISCPTGSSLVGQQCIQQQQQIVVQPLPCPQCPEGSGLVNGQCIVSALPSQVTVGQAPDEYIILGHHFHHEGALGFLNR